MTKFPDPGVEARSAYILSIAADVLADRQGIDPILQAAANEQLLARTLHEFDLASSAVNRMRRQPHPRDYKFANRLALDRLTDGKSLPHLGGISCMASVHANVGLVHSLVQVNRLMERAEIGSGEPQLTFAVSDNVELTPARRVTAGAIQVAGRYITGLVGLAPDKPLSHPVLGHRTDASTIVMDAILEGPFLATAVDGLRDGILATDARAMGWYRPSEVFHPDFTALANA